MPTQISSDYGQSIPPNIRPSNGQPNYSLATTYINLSSPPLAEVSDHYTNVRGGPGTGGSYPVDLSRGPMMGPSTVGLPLVDQGWSQGAPGSYSGGGALGEATPPFMGTSNTQTFTSPSWWPGVQRGDYPGSVTGSHGSVSVSAAPFAEVSEQFAQRSPWHNSQGTLNPPKGTIYNISGFKPAALEIFSPEFALLMGAAVLGAFALGGLWKEGKWTDPFFTQYKRGFKDTYEGERDGGLF